jgi:hypothetical protein
VSAGPSLGWLRVIGRYPLSRTAEPVTAVKVDVDDLPAPYGPDPIVFGRVPRKGAAS